MTRTSRALLAAVLGLGAAAATAAVGFEAGRRYPFSFLDRYLPTPGNWFWNVTSPAPFTVYEAGVASLGDSAFVFGGFIDVERHASAAVHVYDGVTDTWVRKGDMPTSLTHANAVRIGRSIWIAGGFTGQHPGPGTTAVWRYEIDSDSWSSGPPLPEIRGAGALVALGNTLHYYGGYLADRNTVSTTHWRLDLDAPDSARRWLEAAPLPVGRGHLSGVALGGYAYAIGGAIRHDPYQIDIADVHRYDPSSDSWTTVAPLPFARSHAEPSTFVRDGRILVIGGRSRPTGTEASASVTEYDPATNRWTGLAPLPRGRVAPIAALIGDRVLVAAGGDAGALPRSKESWIGQFGMSWSPGRPMPMPLGEVAAGIIGDRMYVVGHDAVETLALDLRSGQWDDRHQQSVRVAAGHHHASEVVAGRWYLIGGLGGVESVVQVFDPVTNSWSFGPDLPLGVGSAATAAIGGIIYLAGGIAGDSTTRLAFKLDPITGTWSSIAPMPRARNHAASGTDGTRFYVFGGRGPGSGDRNELANGFNDVQVYNPATDRWLVSGEAGGPAALPLSRGGMGKAVYVDGEFWVMGGETLDGPGATPEGVFDRVDIFNPATNSWREGPRMPTGRHGIFPVLAGDRILVAGGGTRAASSISGLLEVLDAWRAGPAAVAGAARP